MSYRVGRIKRLARLFVAAAFSLCLASATMAQRTPAGPPPGAGPPPNNNPNLQDRGRQVDESRLRSAELDIGREERSQKLLQAAIANMKEDFSRIQVVRNDIVRRLIANKPVDYNLLSEQAAEINKRASRLNVYMRARAPEEEKENNLPELKSEEMIDALVRLCKLIDSFTENPALKNAAMIDAKDVEKAKQDKVKADGDLLAIIKLSGSVQKKSDSLKVPK
jgi:Spy/CpxP family protein refolding chaperone